MQIRTATEADLDRILAIIADKSINTADPERYRRLLDLREYRLEWTFIAGDFAAVAVWWGNACGEHPLALDGLFAAPDADPVPLWTELIRHATSTIPGKGEQPSYHIFLPGGWRDDATIGAALEPRLAAAQAAGMPNLLERLRFEWTPAAGVPARSARLTFRAEPDDSAFLDVFQQVAAGSLDAGTRETVARIGLAAYAQEDLDVYLSMRGERSWWKLAYTPSGELAGFAIPSANSGGPVVGFLGVVPEHRGHGYSDDLLAEITADLADLGAQRIAADTDVGNTPMAASFRRLGYHNFAVRLVASA